MTGKQNQIIQGNFPKLKTFPETKTERAHESVQCGWKETQSKAHYQTRRKLETKCPTNFQWMEIHWRMKNEMALGFGSGRQKSSASYFPKWRGPQTRVTYPATLPIKCEGMYNKTTLRHTKSRRRYRIRKRGALHKTDQGESQDGSCVAGRSSRVTWGRSPEGRKNERRSPGRWSAKAGRSPGSLRGKTSARGCCSLLGNYANMRPLLTLGGKLQKRKHTYNT